MSNYIHGFVLDMATHPYPNLKGGLPFRACTSKYIPLFYIDGIIYPCPYPDVALADHFFLNPFRNFFTITQSKSYENILGSFSFHIEYVIKDQYWPT